MNIKRRKIWVAPLMLVFGSSKSEAKKAPPKKKLRIFKTPEGLEYTIEDTKIFSKKSGGKHAIWHGKPTKAFIAWLEIERAK